MAKDSRRVRKIRRIKLERSRAYRLMEVALHQRDQARMIAYHLGEELKKRDKDALAPTPDPVQPVEVAPIE